jgi:PncC family amidohydrolase
LTTAVERAGRLLRQRGLTLAAMESCTGGLLSAVITRIPGCGDFFLGAVVSYATEVKQRMGVSAETIETLGVCSSETAHEMAEVVRRRLGADIGVGITGVAGPDPQDGVPVGVVFIAIDDGASLSGAWRFDFGDIGPEDIKRKTVEAVASLLEAACQSGETPVELKTNGSPR